MELPKQYTPKEVEKKWYALWEKNHYFTPSIDNKVKRDQRFTIVIPPPNVTGILHMGHALNNSIQDILIRYERMRGKKALWVPGVDHAGIATQNVVEKKLTKSKKTRHDLGREKFIDEVWQWKEEHGSTIVKQLRRLGASCDWTRERFTMDEGLSHAVREAFVTLYERGLIYRGNYIINWCPRCHTALSDEEAAHKDLTGALYHIQYPLADNPAVKVEVATTRPETMLGDTAVAVHPDDERYRHLIGKSVMLPLMNRKIPVIADEFVDPKFGTGVVKVTPAHDPNDFAFQGRHPEVAVINILNENGTINENGGPYKDLDRFKARKRVIEDLEKLSLFVKEEKHQHAVGHCYRCDTIVEPYLSKQWFVKMKPMAEKAIRAYRKGETKFVPERWNKVYLSWLENIRDWCISRQIWWGHQIPVWYCDSGVIASAEGARQSPHKKIASPPKADRNDKCQEPIVSRKDITECPHCGSKKIVRDPDVLDTWFSSWLWPFSTLGWPDQTKDLDYFYPTSVLVTAPEIIFFWVARMVMAGLEFTGQVPFHTIYIHGTVRTDSGQKMSKSLGNAIDPLVVIDEMGADALRFSILRLTASGQDAYLSRQKFELGRNFTNKIWNASRFVLMNFEQAGPFEIKTPKLSNIDKWILTDLSETAQKIDKLMGEYRFNDVAGTLYDFFWGSFCDWYVELTKPVLKGEEGEERSQTVRSVLAIVLDQALRLLHPLMPFVTEEIWQQLKHFAKDKRFAFDSLMVAPWQAARENFSFTKEADEVRLFQEAVVGVRDIRTRLGISPKEKISVQIAASEPSTLAQVKRFETEIKHLTNTADIFWHSKLKKESGMIGKVYAHMEIYVANVPEANIKQEESKTRKRIQELENYIKSIDQKLSNQNFVARAPQELVEEQHEKKSAALKELSSHQENLALLSGK
ncbi:MAG: valine--tRNA ligase [Candidatus Omnitrophica bacterium CG11_big_fil_rev_8_21_14_0_20_45_26]|uniref:Valine--tRNA ligase n=1 Tax=Candidatus Abzuiibacterium crystallinum TaxID=1974748 RepID=A0A2H0LPS1_9BACT|nr:MAG: valine--tRNA ligase [Candidatus Omnitrophica bacterium CG11_big_fil_rev_8_21_14_0_20_45_26]PIW63549.1 MAG: valine--tRNA ligase [Candidatus Omnitrophica bacterium CG12_big_fil_rev_8_21_14_0_65_45_16]